MQYKDEDLIGKRFGRLTVISVFKKKTGEVFRRYCHCKCDCGKECDPRIDCLVSNKEKSCGCLNIERSKTHGYSKHKLYKSFYRIIKRCTDKTNKDYKYYGARGIKLCDEWRYNPRAFVEYCLENGWKEDLTIDRIDVNGNYEPSNIRFVNLHIQCANQRLSVRNTSGYKGVSYRKDCDKWRSWIGIGDKLIHLGTYKTQKDALEARNNYIIENKLFEYPIQEWKGE